MEFERKIVRTREVRTVEISETVICEPMPWKYARKEQTWQPTAIRVHFTSDRHNGGEWSRWDQNGAIHVVGYNIKADGSRGADRDESHWGHHEGPFASHVLDILAELNAAADMLSPWTGDVVPLP